MRSSSDHRRDRTLQRRCCDMFVNFQSETSLTTGGAGCYCFRSITALPRRPTPSWLPCCCCSSWQWGFSWAAPALAPTDRAVLKRHLCTASYGVFKALGCPIRYPNHWRSTHTRGNKIIFLKFLIFPLHKPPQRPQSACCRRYLGSMSSSAQALHAPHAAGPPVAGVEISVWCGAWAPLRSTFVVSRLSAPKFHPEIACCSIFIFEKMFYIFHQNRQVLLSVFHACQPGYTRDFTGWRR